MRDDTCHFDSFDEAVRHGDMFLYAESEPEREAFVEYLLAKGWRYLEHRESYETFIGPRGGIINLVTR